MKTSQISLFFALSGMFLLLSLAGCKKAECQARPNTNCICPHVYDPVCGCNGVTYGNDCEANCNGITEFTSGACR